MRKKKAPVEKIRPTREAAGLSQRASAELVHVSLKTWSNWELGDREMAFGFWELFLLKTGVKERGPNDE